MSIADFICKKTKWIIKANSREFYSFSAFHAKFYNKSTDNLLICSRSL